jgi:flagellar hook assembly protein FlgD
LDCDGGSVTIAFQGERGTPLRSIRVVDVMGRVVATLSGGSENATLRWDGRDRQGREVASGVYRIVTLRPDGHVGGSERVLILR